MQADCEVYVDPEEDEVFFGCVSEREKTVCAKLEEHEGSNPKEGIKLHKILDDCDALNEDEVVFGSKLVCEQRSQLSPKLSRDDSINQTTDSVEPQERLNNSLLKDEASSKIISNNTSVELEHNYSTPMKHKIDKSILTTPKSMVRADKDGGFLKVLSEIALVKAEAEGDKKSDKIKEDEDKENIASVPEIKIIEATPEKGTILSPPKSINSELRRFRIIYNSPQNEGNIDRNSKSHIETFENERNLKNKCLNEEVDKFLENGNRKSIDLIDLKEFTEPGGIKDSSSPEGEETEVQTQKGRNAIEEESQSSADTIAEEKSFAGGIIALPESSECGQREPEKKSPKFGLRTPRAAAGCERRTKGLRFSKEARKVVEVLKRTTAEDTLNFTISEINLEEEENSFLSPEPVSIVDDAFLPLENVLVKPPKVITESTYNKMEKKSKTIEKERPKHTPLGGQGRPGPIKYFSERRLFKEYGSEIKNGCAKRLPFDEKGSGHLEKARGGTSESTTSRIPVFGAKGSKIPSAGGMARPLAPKVTPSKSPLIRTYKNSKFNHIESPINAYIHNKPTSLVLNVKPEPKKDSLTKVWKAQTAGSVKNVEEKAPKTQSSVGGAGAGLPFVEYKSTTPYKIEKRPESRLPRLAPTVMKLIGPHSPRVLKHEGRFYLNSPRREDLREEGTIVADPKEVSVVEPAEKEEFQLQKEEFLENPISEASSPQQTALSHDSS